MTSSIADQSIKDAEFEKFFQTYVDTQSSALVDPGKIQALAEFYLPSIAFYGWFGEVHSEQNSRDDVMVRQSISQLNCWTPEFTVKWYHMCSFLALLLIIRLITRSAYKKWKRTTLSSMKSRSNLKNSFIMFPMTSCTDGLTAYTRSIWRTQVGANLSKKRRASRIPATVCKGKAPGRLRTRTSRKPTSRKLKQRLCWLNYSFESQDGSSLSSCALHFLPWDRCLVFRTLVCTVFAFQGITTDTR